MPDSTVVLPEALTREFLLHHSVCPKSFDSNGVLAVAATEATQIDALDEIGLIYDCEVRAEPASSAEIERLVERLATRAERSFELARPEDELNSGTTDVRNLASQPPVVRYVNLIVRDAYDARASDIHLEARRDGLSARFRLDGVLVPATEPPAELHHAIISRIKLLAELDIAERRKPQDGRIRVRLEDRELDIRVSTVPTMFGESVVLRLLDHGGRPVSLDALGMSSHLLSIMQEAVRKPHGLILVTGPTGSGKTTTLYASLASRDALTEKIVTVEDPVEYQLLGVTQVPVHRQAGVTFAAALRSILRQDPDVIMIGEMRDAETAEVAIQAALTGHLVLATLHTNDAIGAIPRLLDLGVPAYLLTATVETILAQRLVRRTCEGCATSAESSPAEIEKLCKHAIPEGLHLRRGMGCALCRNTGFRGRTGIYELVVFNDALRAAITDGTSRTQLRTIAIESGMVPMQQDGWRKVQDGRTTPEEVLRVLQI